MNNLFRGLIAGYGAKKLGGGCFSMILIFIVIWVALGQCEQGGLGERRKKNPAIVAKTAKVAHVPKAERSGQRVAF